MSLGIDNRDYSLNGKRAEKMCKCTLASSGNLKRIKLIKILSVADFTLILYDIETNIIF